MQHNAGQFGLCELSRTGRFWITLWYFVSYRQGFKYLYCDIFQHPVTPYNPQLPTYSWHLSALPQSTVCTSTYSDFKPGYYSRESTVDLQEPTITQLSRKSAFPQSHNNRAVDLSVHRVHTHANTHFLRFVLTLYFHLTNWSQSLTFRISNEASTVCGFPSLGHQAYTGPARRNTAHEGTHRFVVLPWSIQRIRILGYIRLSVYKVC